MTKTFLLMLALGFANLLLPAQEVPRIQKYAIGESGMNVYMPGDPGEFELTHSEDGSDVYTGEVSSNDFNFAVIAVKFAQPMDGSKEDLEALLTAYMDYLQAQFGIVESAGYGHGHTLDSDEDAYGVIDYWLDDEGSDWVVKGWVKEDYIAVLCIYGKGDYPYYSVQDMFLQGIRFPLE
jgi:hypothetical protein